MKKCSKCGYEGNSLFCPECGSEMVEMVSSEVTETVTDGSQGGEKLTPESAISNNVYNEAAPQKKSKVKIIIPIVVAVIVIMGVIVFSSQPEVVSIEAEYNGDCSSETIINNESDFTITATYDDDSQEEVTGWNVDEYTLHPGINNVDITYQDKTTSLGIYSPVMEDGKYIATVNQIKEVFDYYATSNLDGYTELTPNDEADGDYLIGGINKSKLTLASISFTQKDGKENIGVDGNEIPDSVVISTLGSNDDTDYEVIYSVGGAGLYAIDPKMNYDESVDFIREATKEAVAEGVLDGANTGFANKAKIKNEEKVTTMVYAGDGGIMNIYSFQEK